MMLEGSDLGSRLEQDVMLSFFEVMTGAAEKKPIIASAMIEVKCCMIVMEVVNTD